MKHRLIAAPALTAALMLGAMSETLAAPYASGLRNLGGGQIEFVLNEAADNVTINLDVGGSLNLGALGAGRHNFSLGSATNFDISVSRSASAGYTAVDDSANLFTSFDRPGGLQINTIPSSPYFGTIYVNQNRGDTNSSVLIDTPPVTGAGRTLGNGVYSLTADRMGVNLTDFSVPSDPSDVSLAKTGGIFVEQASSSSFYRIGMDEAGNIIAADWTNTVGGLKYLSADLTTGHELFTQTGATTGGVIGVDGMGPYVVHGSIVGEPQVRGVYGVNMVVSAMDEDIDADFTFDNANDANAVWAWDFGSATSPTDPRPSLVIAPGDLYTSSGADKNTSGVNFPAFSQNPAGTHSDGSPVFLDYNVGVVANAQYNAHWDKWYLTGSRSNGDDSSSLVVLTPEGPGGDGRDIQVDWASKQFTIDNGLDGYADNEAEPLSLDPHNDIFRNANAVAFSPDNKTLFVMRRLFGANNPVLGTDSDYGAAILAVPLDENGVPNITVDDNGTPEDTSDDFLSNVTPIFASENGAGSFVYKDVKVDAAGNVYYTSNISEQLEYFSLGGNSVAVTSNNASLTAGAFNIDFIDPIDGDYNGDGVVDAADYTVWRDTLGSTTDLRADGNGNGTIDGPLGAGNDYEVWTTNYGASASASSSTVPEPTAAVLAALGVAALLRRRG